MEEKLEMPTAARHVSILSMLPRMTFVNWGNRSIRRIRFICVRFMTGKNRWNILRHIWINRVKIPRHGRILSITRPTDTDRGRLLYALPLWIPLNGGIVR